MANFAGSRSLDERRRRWLAAEDERLHQEAAITPAPAYSIHPLPGLTPREPVAINTPQEFFPLRKMISKKLWKLWAVVSVVMLVGAASCALELGAGRLEGVLPRGFVSVLVQSADSVANSFRTTLMIICSQLALLIWWARSQSLKDFDGRYRIWRWVAVAWFGFAACISVDAHLLMEQTLSSVRVIRQGDLARLTWLAPLVAWGICIWWTLHNDMKGCRLSLPFLWLTYLTWGVSASLLFVPLQPEWAGLSTALFASGQLFLFSSMLFHVHHVIYCTSEPPGLDGHGNPIKKPKKVKQKKGKAEDDSTEQGAEKPAKKTRSRSAAKKAEGQESESEAPKRKTTRKKPTTRKTAASKESEEQTETPAEAPPEPVKVVVEEKQPPVKAVVEGKKAPVKSVPEVQTKVAPSKPPVEEPAAKVETGTSKAASGSKGSQKASVPVAVEEPKAPAAKAAPVEPPKPVKPEVPVTNSDDDDDDEEFSDSGDGSSRVDGPDPAMLKGLSKRERRKVRKEWKDRQRAG